MHAAQMWTPHFRCEVFDELIWPKPKKTHLMAFEFILKTFFSFWLFLHAIRQSMNGWEVEKQRDKWIFERHVNKNINLRVCHEKIERICNHNSMLKHIETLSCLRFKLLIIYLRIHNFSMENETEIHRDSHSHSHIHSNSKIWVTWNWNKKKKRKERKKTGRQLCNCCHL